MLNIKNLVNNFKLLGVTLTLTLTGTTRNRPETHGTYPEPPGTLTKNQNNKNQIKIMKKQNKNNKTHIEISSLHTAVEPAVPAAVKT